TSPIESCSADEGAATLAACRRAGTAHSYECAAPHSWVLRIRVGPTGRAMRHLDTQPEDPYQNRPPLQVGHNSGWPVRPALAGWGTHRDSFEQLAGGMPAQVVRLGIVQVRDHNFRTHGRLDRDQQVLACNGHCLKAGRTGPLYLDQIAVHMQVVGTT